MPYVDGKFVSMSKFRTMFESNAEYGEATPTAEEYKRALKLADELVNVLIITGDFTELSDSSRIALENFSASSTELREVY